MSASVLVVGDNREIRDLLRRYLERAGLIVRATAHGAEAIRVIDAHGVDLVVLDLGLPDVDGMEMPRAAPRRRAPPAGGGADRPRPVDERIRGLQSSADDYVTKPVQPDRAGPARAGGPAAYRQRPGTRANLSRWAAVHR